MVETGGPDNIRVRELALDDMQDICKLVSISTGGRSCLNPERLWADLNDYGDIQDMSPIKVDLENEVEIESKRTNRPAIQGFTVDVDGHKNAGYVLFSYYYSPWTGICIFLKDIFVVEQLRLKGVGTKLMDKIKEVAVEEKTFAIIFEVSRLSKELREKAVQLGYKVVRGENCDWSVFRIDL